MRIFKSFGIFLLNILICHSANILYVIPFTSKSHYIMLSPVGLELARRGHNVTVITAFKEDIHPPTYHQVYADDIKIWESTNEPRPNIFTMTELSMEAFHDLILWRGGQGTTEIALKSKEVIKFLDNKYNTFDLVISEMFYQEAFYALAHKYNAPLVLITTYGNCMKNNLLLGNPAQMSTVMNEFIQVRDPKSLMGRLKNLYFNLYEYYQWRYNYLEKQEGLARKYIKDLPKPVPNLIDIQRNVSVVLMNSHFSVDSPRAYYPNLIEVGGLHLKDSENQLPNDLKKILDEAKHGVVYMNFGTNVRSAELPTEKKNAFLNVFRRLRETVIWKWEDTTMENKPKNVIIRNWFPQKEIFAHPNIKLFISHGGLIGTQEAIFNGIPIVGMPIYADQYNNLLRVQKNGHGKIIEYNLLTEEYLDKVVNEVLKNDTFKIRAKEIQTRFRDRPMKPLDTAVFWIEYVVKYKGASFLKSPLLKMNWMSFYMLDVYLFILMLIMIILAIIMICLWLIIGKGIRKSKTKSKYE